MNSGKCLVRRKGVEQTQTRVERTLQPSIARILATDEVLDVE